MDEATEAASVAASSAAAAVASAAASISASGSANDNYALLLDKAMAEAAAASIATTGTLNEEGGETTKPSGVVYQPLTVNLQSAASSAGGAASGTKSGRQHQQLATNRYSYRQAIARGAEDGRNDYD